MEVFYHGGPADGESQPAPHSELSEHNYTSFPPDDEHEAEPHEHWPCYRMKLTLQGWIWQHEGTLGSHPELLAKLRDNFNAQGPGGA